VRSHATSEMARVHDSAEHESLLAGDKDNGIVGTDCLHEVWLATPVALSHAGSLRDQFVERKHNQDKLSALFGDLRAGGDFFSIAKSMVDAHGKDAKINKRLSYDEVILRKSYILNAVSLIGIVLFIIHTEVNWNSEGHFIEDSTPLSYLMRFLIALDTAILVCALFDSYQMEVWLYRKFETANIEEQEARFWPMEYIAPFCGELFICIIHPIPWILPNKIGIFMFLRLWLLARLIREHTELYQKRAIVWKSGYVDRGGPPIDTTLCLKVAMDKNPGLFLSSLLGIVVLVFAYAQYLIQREGDDAGDMSFFKCLWACAFLLFRGVSRFDTYDTPGRIIELVTVFVGVICLAIFIAVITSRMEVSRRSERCSQPN